MSAALDDYIAYIAARKADVDSYNAAKKAAVDATNASNAVKTQVKGLLDQYTADVKALLDSFAAKGENYYVRVTKEGVRHGKKHLDVTLADGQITQATYDAIIAVFTRLEGQGDTDLINFAKASIP